MSMTASEIAWAAKGKRAGAGWLIRCPAPGHVDRHPSCSVADGPNGPVFNCHALCDWRDVRQGAEALGWIQPFKRQPRRSLNNRLIARATATAARHQYEAEIRVDEKRRIAKAQGIWNNANDDHDRIGRYFTDGRSIQIVPPIFRFNPAVWHPYEKCQIPAIVAQIRNTLSDHYQGVHCIFLNKTGDGKADIERPKLSFGVLIGGAVRLAPADDRLALCEGIESGLSYMQLSGCPTWSTLGTAGMKPINVPSHIQNVVIAADNDPPGLVAARAAARQFRIRGLAAEITRPKQKGADWNDLLKGAGQ